MWRTLKKNAGKGSGDKNKLNKMISLKHINPSAFSAVEEQAFIKEITRSMRDSEDLLRSLANSTHKFIFTGEEFKISMDLVVCMYETVWFQFNAITEDLLEELKFNPSVTNAALDILCYSLTSSIFLDMKMEIVTFANQLLKFQQLCRKKCINFNIELDDSSWYDLIEISDHKDAMDAIAEVHRLVITLKDVVHEVGSYELTRAVANRLNKKSDILDQNIFFVREGDLSKRSRNGRQVLYRFFLFSDQLLYAHMGSSGEYKVHETLDLQSMSLGDCEDVFGCSFYIYHPIKSFVVVAETVYSKSRWINEITSTIDSSLKRQKSSHSRKRGLSIVHRIETQKHIIKNEIKHRNSASLKMAAPPPDASPQADASPPPDASPQASPSVYSAVSGNQRQGKPKRKTIQFSECTKKDEDSDYFDPEVADAAVWPFSPRSQMMSSLKEQEEPQLLSFNEDTPPSSPKRREPLQQLLQGMEADRLEALYAAGAKFWTSLPDSKAALSSSPAASDSLRLHGLQRRLQDGPVPAPAEGPNLPPPPPTDQPLLLEAWTESSGLSDTEARQQFLLCLSGIAPYWKYEQFL